MLQFGEPAQVVTEPGLHVKAPWPLQNVLYIDKRVLNLDLPAQEVIAQDKKRLVVDAFARWRITDALRFYQSLTDEGVAQVRLQPILGSNVRRIPGAQTFAAVLSGERAKLMVDIKDGVNSETKEFRHRGSSMCVSAAPISRPRTVTRFAIAACSRSACVKRMNIALRASRFHRKSGSKADRDATVIPAEAQRQAEIHAGGAIRRKTASSPMPSAGIRTSLRSTAR